MSNKNEPVISTNTRSLYAYINYDKKPIIIISNEIHQADVVLTKEGVKVLRDRLNDLLEELDKL